MVGTRHERDGDGAKNRAGWGGVGGREDDGGAGRGGAGMGW